MEITLTLTKIHKLVKDHFSGYIGTYCMYMKNKNNKNIGKEFEVHVQFEQTPGFLPTFARCL
jgi:hypothetical protein